MISRILSRAIVPTLLVLAALLYWKVHTGPPKAISVGYVADRDVILWNTLAQVREETAEVHYGDRVEVLRVDGTSVQVRAASGAVGWMRDSREMMDSDLWGKSTALLEKARTLPVQARGRTKTVSNVRVEPGRDAKRTFQFSRGTRVLILQRAVADASSGPEENAQEEKLTSASEQKPKMEDWLLVLRDESSHPNEETAPPAGNGSVQVKLATADAVSSGPGAVQTATTEASGAAAGPIAGWVLARFIEMDLPDAVKDYASAADLHVMAWFELNRVPDGAGGEAPQYLVAASRGPEGQPCDFTMLRVYTWGIKRKRYETAYVESDLCGRLPVGISQTEKGAQFHFPDIDQGGADRSYEMIQTAVRRLKSPSAGATRTRK